MSLLMLSLVYTSRLPPSLHYTIGTLICSMVESGIDLVYVSCHQDQESHNNAMTNADPEGERLAIYPARGCGERAGGSLLVRC